MSDVPLIYLGVNSGCMNGRNMVLPRRGRSEELRCEGREWSLSSQLPQRRHLNLYCPQVAAGQRCARVCFF